MEWVFVKKDRNERWVLTDLKRSIDSRILRVLYVIILNNGMHCLIPSQIAKQSEDHFAMTD